MRADSQLEDRRGGQQRWAGPQSFDAMPVGIRWARCEKPRQRASCGPKIYPASNNARSGRRSGRGGKLFAARRALFSSDCRRAGGPSWPRQKRPTATARRRRGRSDGRRWRFRRAVRVAGSPRRRSEQNAYQQPQQGFQPQPNHTFNSPQPFAERPPYEGDRQDQDGSAGLCQLAGPAGQPVSRTRRSGKDRPFADRNEGYRDNRHGRDGRSGGTSRPYRDSQTTAFEGTSAPKAPSQPELPSFITASPRYAT